MKYEQSKMKNNNIIESAIMIYLISNPIIVAVKYVSIFYIALYVILSMLLFFHICKKIYIKDILLYFFCLIELVISLFAAYQNLFYNWFGIVVQICLIALPWFCIGTHMVSARNIYYEMINNSKFIMLTSIIMILFVAYIGEYTKSGNMAVSYALLPYCALLFDKAVSQKNIRYFILCTFVVLFILLYGSRGPVLGFGIFCVIYVIRHVKEHRIMFFSAVAVISFVLINWQNVLNIIKRIKYRYGISSRTIDQLLNGTITSDTGRSNYYKATIDVIIKYPVTGLGLAGERPYLLETVTAASGKSISSVYPHNFVLEFLAQYGILLGVIFVIVVISFLISGIWNENIYKSKIILIIGVTEIVHLMLSSTYTISPLFFFFLGLSVNKNMDKRKGGDTINEKESSSGVSRGLAGS